MSQPPVVPQGPPPHGPFSWEPQGGYVPGSSSSGAALGPQGYPPMNQVPTQMGPAGPHAVQQPPMAAPKKGNVFGLISLIVGVLVVVLEIVSTVASRAIISAGEFELWQLVNVTFTIAIGVLAAAGIALGIVGLTRPNRPKGTAGIGVGISSLHLAMIVEYFILSW